MVLHVDAHEVADRQRRAGAGHDRLEAAGEDFHQRVAGGFLDWLPLTRSHWRVVDGTGSVDAVAARVAAVVADFFASAV